MILLAPQPNVDWDIDTGEHDKLTCWEFLLHQLCFLICGFIVDVPKFLFRISRLFWRRIRILWRNTFSIWLIIILLNRGGVPSIRILLSRGISNDGGEPILIQLSTSGSALYRGSGGSKGVILRRSSGRVSIRIVLTSRCWVSVLVLLPSSSGGVTILVVAHFISKFFII